MYYVIVLLRLFSLKNPELRSGVITSFLITESNTKGVTFSDSGRISLILFQY
jgi:hypothetical protein